MTVPLPLIASPDASEVVRDKIAEILVTEQAAQQALAQAAAEDPRLWELRVFVERSNPWSEFQQPGPDDDQLDVAPIINVAVDNLTYDASASNQISRQKTTAIYHLECYGYGVAKPDGAGQSPGDHLAALTLQRAVRLVRNILMAGEYTYLDLRGTIWRRWIRSIQFFEPSFDTRAIQHVLAARIAFEVGFNEMSPQVSGETLEAIGVTVKRTEDGEIVLQADYGPSDWT